MSRPSVAIVGGGILGMTAAYRLSQAGVDVTLYERAPDLGGLVGSFDFDGTQADRFYHVVLPTDDRVLGLAEELGLRDTFRFRPTKVGFYGGGRRLLGYLAEGLPHVPAAASPSSGRGLPRSSCAAR